MIDYDALAAANNGAATIQPKVQVFTGIVSQGVLGAPQDFMPSKSALIQSMDDLEAEAHKDAANLLVSLPGMLRYAVKFASNFKNADGSIEQAGSQQVVTGYTTKGVPKYKTVRNKFAVMTVSLKGSNGQMHKIIDINLGPVDAATVVPSQFQLNDLTNNVSANIVTTDHADFGAVVSPTPTDVINVHPEAQQTQEQQDAIQAAIDAASNRGRPLNPQTSTTRAEAENNRVPIRFQTVPMPNGFPVTILYVGETPNLLYNGTELDLKAAQDLISATPPEHRVDLNGLIWHTNTEPVYQVPGKIDFYPGHWVKLAALGSFNGSIDDVLSGSLPPSQFVWAYKTKSGEVQTFVPLSRIPLLP